MRFTRDPSVDSPVGAQEGLRSPASPESQLRDSPSGDFCVLGCCLNYFYICYHFESLNQFMLSMIIYEY